MNQSYDKGSLPPYSDIFGGPSNITATATSTSNRHIDPIDPAAYTPYKETCKDMFRCRIHDDVLFQLHPRSNTNPRSHVSTDDPDSITPVTLKQRDLGDGPTLQVESSTLECLIAAARSPAYFAASSLNPTERLMPHQIPRRQLLRQLLGDETAALQRFRADPRLAENLTYQRCLQTCRDATEAVRRLLGEALERYERDPDVLWRLWMHQSVSFAWESQHVLGVLKAWSEMFPPGGGSAGQSVWDGDAVEARKAAAREGYAARVAFNKQREAPCSCMYVDLSKRSFGRRLKDLFRRPAACYKCREKTAAPMHSWVFHGDFKKWRKS
ncbi:hypothetical protein TWF696_001688 [Orbilia brochopaga]|uniref:Uncharacterized protein n=1 Tax=Orbilia brochopaga TaxID=3140254 RepID=A0AAV9U698_9PEZI